MLEVVEHLEKLGRGEIEPQIESKGICEEIFSLFEVRLRNLFGWDEYREVLSRWDKFSGHLWYPIPHRLINHPGDAYQSTVNLWIEEYGDNRRELCLHLAKELRNICDA